MHGLGVIMRKKQGGNNRYPPFEKEAEILDEFKKKAMSGQVITVAKIKKAYEAAVDMK